MIKKAVMILTPRQEVKDLGTGQVERDKAHHLQMK